MLQPFFLLMHWFSDSEGASDFQETGSGAGLYPLHHCMVPKNFPCFQLGLFVEFSPDDMLLGMEETEDDGDLEAELLALTGEAGTTSRKPAPKGHGEFVHWAGLGAGARWAQAVGGEGPKPNNLF